jgi:hypothetical protein
MQMCGCSVSNTDKIVKTQLIKNEPGVMFVAAATMQQTQQMPAITATNPGVA